MIKANITTEIMPHVGSKEQADDLITYISDNSNGDDIWGVNIFGKTIEQLVDDGPQTHLILHLSPTYSRPLSFSHN